MRDIGEIELDDTDLQFVDVSDLPGSKIAFDAVVDAALIVHDEDVYHNDESDNINQWFTLCCRGDLDLHLDDTEIYEINVYNGCNRRDKPMSNALVPIIKRDNLEAKADEFLKKYYPEARLQPMWLDPDELARRMNLTKVRHSISQDGSFLGQICFQEADAKLFDNTSGTEVIEHVFPETMIVDPAVAFRRNVGSYNNTIVHECVH